ncbi:hypothetical protein PFDG_05331 [Plasmodium falciparum Dd2]|uniref:Uncharacterized protein n=1 Tax=Plasmodium falciparum (isolate Dd2) TaxID=57267 RepID=A0A0L7MAD6_PLAF4|nr:hypothetical protein PFDG_05331 [Plasmodium falciparum Dd2]
MERNHDSLRDEMLKNLINLYTKNNSSILTSHMFSHLNNVLCEINNAWEIFTTSNAHSPLKTNSDNSPTE